MKLTSAQAHELVQVELILLNNANRINCVAAERPWPHFTNAEHCRAAAADLRAVAKRLDTLATQLEP